MLHKELITRLVTATLLATLLLAGKLPAEGSEAQPSRDGDPHAGHRATESQPQSASAADVTLFDVELVTQAGERAKFSSQIIGDRVVAINIVYTSCTTVCPVTTAIFAQVQQRLGERLDRDVLLLSISVDPTRDSPERLAAYARKHRARPGWVWLTGEKNNVDQVLTGLGAYTPNFEDHPSMVIVGDPQTNRWSRFFGFPSPSAIVARLDELVAGQHHRVAGSVTFSKKQ